MKVDGPKEGLHVGDQESGPKWTVQKDESGRSLPVKWTICPKMDGHSG